jgi:hypothetical protein
VIFALAWALGSPVVQSARWHRGDNTGFRADQAESECSRAEANGGRATKTVGGGEEVEESCCVAVEDS